MLWMTEGRHLGAVCLTAPTGHEVQDPTMDYERQQLCTNTCMGVLCFVI